MLPYPVVPVRPVTVKETVVVCAVWFVVIVTLAYCEVVMLPFTIMLTVELPSLVAEIVFVVVCAGVGVMASDTVNTELMLECPLLSAAVILNDPA